MLPGAKLCWLLVLVPGCQIVFPLDEPPPESRCPDLGSTPVFASRTMNLLDQRVCFQFTTAAGRGVGPCQSDAGSMAVFENTLDEHLVPANVTPIRTNLASAVIDPESRLITAESDASGNLAIETYERAGTRWTHVAETPITTSSVIRLGMPSRSPRARLAMFDMIAKEVVELEEVAGRWEPAMTYASPFGELQPGINNSSLHQTADGRGVLFTSDLPGMAGRKRLGYADRTSIDEPFGVAREIAFDVADLFADASLDANCTRLYLAEFTGVYFVTPD